MKLSISNIGWTSDDDEKMYELLKKYDFKGLEIAPTRIFPEDPYDKIAEAEKFAQELFKDYNLEIPSMQSIWFGRNEKIFGEESERNTLLEYTKKAIDFAHVIRCSNLVFGCPRNRAIPEGADEKIAVSFFKTLGDYAASKNTVIGMEANPPIYNTNFVTDTKSAFELIKKVDSDGFKLNLDVGTMIQNGEDISELMGNEESINHVHISEPGLKSIEERKLHQELRTFLEGVGYQGYVSIEMGKVEDLSVLEEKLDYIRGIFS